MFITGPGTSVSTLFQVKITSIFTFAVQTHNEYSLLEPLFYTSSGNVLVAVTWCILSYLVSSEIAFLLALLVTKRPIPLRSSFIGWKNLVQDLLQKWWVILCPRLLHCSMFPFFSFSFFPHLLPKLAIPYFIDLYFVCILTKVTCVSNAVTTQFRLYSLKQKGRPYGIQRAINIWIFSQLTLQLIR